MLMARSPGDVGGLDVLVQSKISKKAAKLLKDRAEAEARTAAGYIRRLIYLDLGLLDP